MYKVESHKNNDYYILKSVLEYLGEEKFKLTKEFKLSEIVGV